MKVNKKEVIEQLKKDGLKADVLRNRGEITTIKQTENNMKKTGIERL